VQFQDTLAELVLPDAAAAPGKPAAKPAVSSAAGPTPGGPTHMKK
jgi:hypothetical protein